MKRLLALSLPLLAAFAFALPAHAATVYANFPDGNATSSVNQSPYPSPVGVLFKMYEATNGSYAASTTPIGTVTLWLSATGTPTGTMLLAATSSAGYVGLSSMQATSSAVSVSGLSSVPQPFTFSFPSPVTCNRNLNSFADICYLYIVRSDPATGGPIRLWHAGAGTSDGNQAVFPGTIPDKNVYSLTLGASGTYMVVTSDLTPPSFDLPYIDTFTVSTTTQTYTVTGYSPASTASFGYQVFVNTSQPGFGPLDEDVYNATTTGIFSYTGTYIGTFSTTTLSIVARTVVNDFSKDPFTDPDYSLVTDTETLGIGFEPSGFVVDPYQAFNPYDTCDFTPSGIVGCLKNFGYWLFVPEESIIARWANLPDYVMTRSPFSYVDDAQTLYQSFLNSMVYAPLDISFSTPYGNITLISSEMLSAVPFAADVKNIITWLIWFFFVTSVYNGLRSLFSAPKK